MGVDASDLKRRLREAEARIARMFDVLLLVRQWMDGMPVEPKEVRDKIDEAIRNADGR